MLFRKTSENRAIRGRIHMTVLKAMVVLAMGIIVLGSSSVDAAMRKDITTSKTGLPEAGSFNVIAEPFEWGKDVTRLIINVGSAVNLSDINIDDINVTARHWSEQAKTDDTKRGPRKVIDAYPVDEEGNRVDSSELIVVELEYGKDVQAAHLGSYNYASYYTPLTPYYEVNWNGVGEFNQEAVADLVCDEFTLARHIDESVENKQYNFVDYALYSPKADGKKKPLIIFFHGMGEGGARDLNNKGVQMYAYQEEYFAEKEVQDIMGGSAYVLLPQSPDRWPTDGFTNETKYLQVVKNLIDTVIEENKYIDTNRIYIGGLSMGGFMACRMIINFPEMFAAAFPCSQAYAITAKDAEVLRELPIWISCSEKDEKTCPMDPYTYASYLKLKAAGNTKAKCCVMEDCHIDVRCTFRFYTPDSNDPVIYEIACDEGKENKKQGDLTWNNDTYGGHEAGWIMLFNNKEYYMDGDKKVSVMEWVASQSLVEEIKLDTSKAKLNYNVGEEFSSDGLGVTVVKRDGTTGPAEEYSVLHPDTKTPGKHKVKVTVSGKTAEYEITVADVALSQPTATPVVTASPSAAPTATPAVDSVAVVKVAKVKGLTVKRKGAGKVYVSWKKASKASKYELLYSTDKKFKKGVKKLTVKKTSVTIKKLKSGKKYYFKVRGFAGKVYGSYSAVKNKKV